MALCNLRLSSIQQYYPAASSRLPLYSQQHRSLGCPQGSLLPWLHAPIPTQRNDFVSSTCVSIGAPPRHRRVSTTAAVAHCFESAHAITCCYQHRSRNPLHATVRFGSQPSGVTRRTSHHWCRSASDWNLLPQCRPTSTGIQFVSSVGNYEG